jgi:hypothetical protein
MRMPRRADTTLAHDVYPPRPSSDRRNSPQDHRPVARQTDAGEDHEVDDADLVEMLQAVLARKLREFGD